MKMKKEMITKDIAFALDCLKNGGIICYPTDTVFGLGCSINNYSSIKRIYEIKGRGFNEPLSFAVNNIEELIKYADVNGKQLGKIKELIAKRKHYTFILKKKYGNPCIDLISKDNKIGIRIINHPIVEFLTDYAGPIITTSANMHGRPAVKNIEDLDSKIMSASDLTIDGKCNYGKASIVYDLVDDKIIRK